jgi:osmotically-inducible protein OsmY
MRNRIAAEPRVPNGSICVQGTDGALFLAGLVADEEEYAAREARRTADDIADRLYPITYRNLYTFLT